MEQADEINTMPLFERYDHADVRAMIEAFPLAWVCSGGRSPIEASQLPLIGVFDAQGALVELIGHMMRSNTLYTCLSEAPEATILFAGPDAYISPQHAERRDWAPTWNYAQVRVVADIGFDDALTEPALTILIDAMEAARPAPWHVGELGARYADMLLRIKGFRARVRDVSARFKLGQDESAQTFHAILHNLPDGAMTDWMGRFNRGR